MTADVAQRESNNIKRYASAFSEIVWIRRDKKKEDERKDEK